MKRSGAWLVLAGLVLVLAVSNYTIWQKEQIRTGGRQVLLELRPVDPRSLIQGDFMALRYADGVFPKQSINRGVMVMSLDADGVGTYARMDDGSPLRSDEVRLKFRTISEWGEFGIGAESFFFQEGHAEFYANAKYGVIRVGDKGDSVLIGLADEEHELIRPPDER